MTLLTHIRVNRMDEYDVDGPGVVFDLDGRDGFRIIDTDGLGPVQADILYTKHAMVPGGAFNGSSINIRNIVIQASLEPDYATGTSVTDLRRQVYDACFTGAMVRVRLYTDGVLDRRVDGYVESIEPMIFTEEPSIQVSIICTDPYFRAPESEDVDLTGLDGYSQTFNYDSEIPWGLELTIRPNGPADWIRVVDLNYPASARPSIQINYPFQSGQRLSLVTTKGHKRAQLRRISDDSFIADLLGRCEVTESWPMLTPGTNRIRVRTNHSADSDPLRWDIRLIGRYLGY